MVEPNDADKLNPELENRLDDLFDENNTLLPDNEDRDASEYYPLSELKNLILSIDWEITDEVLGKLLQQIKLCLKLMSHWQVLLPTKRWISFTDLF